MIMAWSMIQGQEVASQAGPLVEITPNTLLLTILKLRLIKV